MAKHRARRRIVKTPHRPAQELLEPTQRRVTREASIVERLAYTRSQAAEALGLSRSTFTRRVLPIVATIEMPWGAKLIPVDELERLVAERRQAAKPRAARVPRGRPPVVTPDLLERIRTERAEGASLHRIAAGLNADRTPTAHGGTKWWPSTIRAALARSEPLASDPTVAREAAHPPPT